jgi:hypothetical protein
MIGNPNNYFSGGAQFNNRPCECCEQAIKVDRDNPALYGSGRFCCERCSKLRTPEKHWNWLTENPEEYKKWVEWKKEQEKTRDRNQLGGDRVFPI